MDINELLTSQVNKDILTKLNDDYQKYFKWFLSLTEIPHPTFQCLPLSNAIQSWLTKMGVSFQHDQKGNIVIHIDANGMPQTTPVFAIQAHIDMVTNGEFNNGKIEVNLIKNHQTGCFQIVADKSTLGADDGFGVALILELVERRNELIHGPLELILTIDEEMGLKGIQMLPSIDGKTNANTGISPLTYKYLINCDSLCGDNVYIGSAGGIVYQNDFLIHPETILINNFSMISISLSNCLGGHSGQCINLGRANAIKVMGRLLNYLLDSNIDFQFAELKGGKKITIIPPFCNTKIIVNTNKESQTLEILTKYSKILKKEFETADPDLTFDIKSEKIKEMKVMSIEETKKIISFITLCPSGTLRMSPFFPQAVDSSLNLGVINLDGDKVKVELFSRSATKAEIDNINQIMKNLFDIIGLKHVDNIWTAGVPWEPNVNSKLAKLMVETFEETCGKKVGISLLHVTIEPPQLQELGYVDTDMISICPSIPKAHSIGEFIDVDEAIRWRNATYKLLSKITE